MELAWLCPEARKGGHVEESQARLGELQSKLGALEPIGFRRKPKLDKVDRLRARLVEKGKGGAFLEKLLARRLSNIESVLGA